eukprot:1885355-Amphidinium_carterae.1
MVSGCCLLAITISGQLCHRRTRRSWHSTSASTSSVIWACCVFQAEGLGIGTVCVFFRVIATVRNHGDIEEISIPLLRQCVKGKSPISAASLKKVSIDSSKMGQFHIFVNRVFNWQPKPT